MHLPFITTSSLQLTDMSSEQDGIISLERLLAYHKRVAAFSTLPQTKSRTVTKEKIVAKHESMYPEDIIRTLWGLLDSIYFKELTPEDLNILHSIADSQFGANSFSTSQTDEDFEQALQEVFSSEYLKMNRRGGVEQQLHKNWREEMRIHWNLMLDDSENGQRNYREFQEKRGAIKGSSLSEIARKQHELFQSFNQSKQTNHSLRRELLNVRMSNCKIIQRVFQQFLAKNGGKRSSFTQECKIVDMGNDGQKISIAKREIDREALLQYFAYQIKNLQKRQVAESIIKILSKRNTQQGTIFEVLFEQAMQLGSVQLNELQLNALNKFRETSLLQYYNAGWKSTLNYVCHNYFGFNTLIEKQQSHSEIQLKPSLLSDISTSPLNCLQGRSSEMFEMMEACHECRLLYDRRTLIKCNNVKQEKQDINFPAFFDPYIYFLIKQDTKVGELAAKIWKDSILTNHYRTGIRNKHVCGRYYCKMCIKGDSNVKCRFCQGNCTCSRCIRSNTIAKFKTIYALLGGDIDSLQKNSYFGQICSKSIPEKNPIVKKDRSSTWISYKMQLQELRLMAHLLMQRQNLKEQLFINEQAILQEKIKEIDGM